MEDQQFIDFESEVPKAIGIGAASIPSTIGQPIVLNRTHVDPPPFLDVLTFHSSRLLSISRKEIEERERQFKKKNNIAPYSSPSKKFGRGDSTSEEEADRLDELLSSVHLLLEPIQLPDLSHTGVFDPSTSLLRPVTPAVPVTKPQGNPTTKLKLSKVDKSDEVKLFYPTGAKNSNMRDYIQETIQKHFSTAELERPLHDKTLGASASAPIFRSPGKISDLDGQLRSTSPSKTRSSGKTVRKKSRFNAIKSPVKTSLAPSVLLNPELTRQAKEVIAAVRANSAKINDLISK